MPPRHVRVHGCFPAPWQSSATAMQRVTPEMLPGPGCAVCSTGGWSKTKARPSAAGDHEHIPEVLQDLLAQHGSRNPGMSRSPCS